MSTYWSWKERHDPSECFPRGESINQALLRYAGALRRLVARPETVVLLVMHEFGLRHIAAAAGELSLFPHPAPHNAAPYLFGEPALRRASDRLEALVHSDPVEQDVVPARGILHRPPARRAPLNRSVLTRQ